MVRRWWLAGLMMVVAGAPVPAARGGVIRPVGIEAFSDQSIFESFEGLTAGENIEAVPHSEIYFEDGSRRTGLDGDGFLRPGVSGPFLFTSGIMMSAPIPNTRESGGGVFIGDFTLGDATFFGPRFPIIDTPAQIPDGTAYLANEGNDLRFELPLPVHRFGFLVSRGSLGVRLFDADGELLLESQVALKDIENPLLGFEYDLPFQSVEFFNLLLPRVDGAQRYVVDGVIADPIPEPSTLVLISLVLATVIIPRENSVRGHT